MIVEVLVGTERLQVEQVDENTFKVGSVVKAVDARVLEPGVYSLLIDGRSYEVSVRKEKEGFLVDIAGHLIPVRFVDPSHPKESTTVDVGPSVITSPMPGRIVGLKVKEGDEVAAGTGVVVVEAMKMENELLAPSSGCVKRIAVKVGDAVEGGQELVEIV